MNKCQSLSILDVLNQPSRRYVPVIKREARSISQNSTDDKIKEVLNNPIKLSDT